MTATVAQLVGALVSPEVFAAAAADYEKDVPPLPYVGTHAVLSDTDNRLLIEHLEAIQDNLDALKERITSGTTEALLCEWIDGHLTEITKLMDIT